MMKLIKYMGVALAMTAFASCNNEDELNFSSWENDPSAVHIQAGVGKDLLARTNPGATDEANQKKFNEGDQISVAAGTQNAVIYTLAAGGTWTPAEGSYLIWKGATMPFKAFYPTTEGTSMAEFTIPTDQSDATKIAAADYMTFTGEIAKADKIDLTFERKTARIMVKLNFNSEYAGTNPTATDLKIKGYSQITNGSSTNLTYFTACKVEGTEVPTYAALVAPNTTPSDNTFFISLKVNSKKFSIKGLPTVDAGNSYTYNLKVGRNTVEVESVSVKDWVTGNFEINNGELTPSDMIINVQEHSITTKRPGTITSSLIATVAGTSKKLKVSGPINGKDIKAIREAAGCVYYNFSETTGVTAIVTDLDLSGASIKASGDIYFNDGWNSSLIEKDNQISNYMFQFSQLTNIVLPSSITSIMDKAFQNSTELTSVNIPNEVTNLGSYVFHECHKLDNIHLPASVKDLGEKCFYKCSNLTNFSMDEGIQITSIPNECFSYTTLPSFTIPSKVTTIKATAFGEVYFNTTFIIPAHVTIIESKIFGDSYLIGGANEVKIEGTSDGRNFDAAMFNGSNKINKLTLDRSWEKDVTNQSTTTDGKLQGDFKGGHFDEIVFTGEGTTPTPDPTPVQP